MSKQIDDFSKLFAQLETTDITMKFPASCEVPHLFSSLSDFTHMETTVAAMRLKYDLNWEAETLYFIQKSEREKLGHKKVQIRYNKVKKMQKIAA